MSVLSTNPASLFGGTWVAWGSGRVPVGINTADSSFNQVEKIGGASAVDFSHSHTVNSHSHTGPAHSHGIAAHLHSTAAMTLAISQIPSHSHSGSVASAGAHTHSTDFQGSHSHYVEGRESVYGSSYGNTFEWWSGGTTVKYVYSNTSGAHSHTASSAGSHGHTFSGGASGGGASHTHGNTGSTTLTTSSAGTGSTGTSAPGTSTALSGAVPTYQPYIVCYMWKRTA